jgi:hypothetical protein
LRNYPPKKAFLIPGTEVPGANNQKLLVEVVDNVTSKLVLSFDQVTEFLVVFEVKSHTGFLMSFDDSRILHCLLEGFNVVLDNFGLGSLRSN